MFEFFSFICANLNTRRNTHVYCEFVPKNTQQYYAHFCNFYQLSITNQLIIE